jgi:hypothetical protein
VILDAPIADFSPVFKDCDGVDYDHHASIAEVSRFASVTVESAILAYPATEHHHPYGTDDELELIANSLFRVLGMAMAKEVPMVTRSEYAKDRRRAAKAARLPFKVVRSLPLSKVDWRGWNNPHGLNVRLSAALL